MIYCADWQFCTFEQNAMTEVLLYSINFKDALQFIWPKGQYQILLNRIGGVMVSVR